MNLNGRKERQSKKKLLGLMNRSYIGESNDKLQAQQVVSNGIEARTLCVCGSFGNKFENDGAILH